MSAEGGIAARIEASASGLVEASFRDLGKATAAATKEHEDRVDGALHTATVQYFQGRDGKAISPEDLAVLHYLQSGGEGLPDADQLAPRLEAAERVFSVISAADMLAIPTRYGTDLAALPEGEERAVGLYSANLRHYRHDTNLFNHVFVTLPGSDRGSVHPFSLIDREGQAVAVETAKAADDLFKRRREEIIARHAPEEGSPLPLVAGSVAISRYAVNLGVQVPLTRQDADQPGSTRTFYGFVRALTGVDAELGKGVIEEVRERKPKAVAMVQAALRHEIDNDFEYVLEDGGDEEWALEQVGAWFEQSEVQLFYTEEELARLREELVDTFVTTLEQRTDKRITAVAKSLEA